MKYTSMNLPEPEAIFQAWMPFKQVVGITSVRTEANYEQAIAILDTLLDEIGDDEDHPLADVLDYLADQVKVYEDEHFPIPASKPHELLRFLMDQYGLKQEDLADCAPQGHLAEILREC